MAPLAATALLVLAQAASPAPTWVAPAEEVARPNPVAASDAVRQRGTALFAEHCVLCHGATGRGDGPSARLHALRARPPEDLTRAEVQTRLTDGEIFWKISSGWRLDGRVIMPRFDEKVTAEDRWALVHHVRSLAAGTR